MIIFTKHAEEKLATKEGEKFKITKQTIIKLLDKPPLEEQLPKGIIRAVGVLNEIYALCVVYKRESGIIKVITFFPARKGRYDNQI